MDLEVKGEFIDPQGGTRKFSFKSDRGMKLEISGGDSLFLKVESHCLIQTVATRVTVSGNIHVVVDDKKIKTDHVIVKRV